MTPEQIQNWRNIIPVMFGIPSSIVSDNDIERLRDGIQNLANRLRCCERCDWSGDKNDTLPYGDDGKQECCPRCRKVIPVNDSDDACKA